MRPTPRCPAPRNPEPRYKFQFVVQMNEELGIRNDELGIYGVSFAEDLKFFS